MKATLNIHIIDDDIKVNHLLKSILQFHGYDSVTLFIKAEASIRYTGTKPDLVFLNFFLAKAEETGLTEIKAVQAVRSTFPYCKLIVISSTISEEQLESCLKAGADGYLQKSNITVDAIGNIVERCHIIKN